MLISVMSIGMNKEKRICLTRVTHNSLTETDKPVALYIYLLRNVGKRTKTFWTLKNSKRNLEQIRHKMLRSESPP